MITLCLSAALALGFMAGCWVFWRKGSLRPENQSSLFDPSKTSVIIPARNEALNLPTLLESIKNNTLSVLEVIVVDDHSSDNTAQIAKNFGATVIPAPKLPSGWTGKNWACHNGSLVAKGDFLLFLDADTWIEIDFLKKIRASKSFQENEVALSLIPFHKVIRPYENFSAFFNLLMTMGTGAFCYSHSVSKRALLTGQMMLVKKIAYQTVGGHEAVKECILENYFMSKQFFSKGYSCRTELGKNLINMRMFPEGFSQLWEGWMKAFAKGTAISPKPALLASIVWLFALMTVITCLALRFELKVVLVFYILFFIQLYGMLKRAGSFPWYVSVIYPVYLLFYQGLFFFSLFQNRYKSKVKWKGRMVG